LRFFDAMLLQFPVTSPKRFRVEVALSPGAAYCPLVIPPNLKHTLPTVPRMHLNQGKAHTVFASHDNLYTHIHMLKFIVAENK